MRPFEKIFAQESDFSDSKFNCIQLIPFNT
jgi:hypothetical protein